MYFIRTPIDQGVASTVIRRGETSWTRRLTIGGLTYLTMVCYLQFVMHINPWFNALVPVIGFLLSTLTVSRLKQRFLDKQPKP